ncbi:hypothetical protein DL89DRAFT_15130 [Linderina pennispora]|uniref:Uncharacterized protein n=1 Tax=Linderina pennispora TaxID=61395 RepID=A0A1Y1WLJ5_9FUNG|nr:uncharacterized protein DL89DRAFT_15130 [Linderina pennispora]ORX74372.1 hypothetical protein DL89DRAFT_15130 [Linderina pennispora]
MENVHCLTPDQAAQRLLSLVQTLGMEGQRNERSTNSKKARNAQPDPSSISWAFHETVDKDGLLRWLAENLDASRNGLCDDELEFLDYLDRIEYTGSDLSAAGEKDLAASFELRAQLDRLEKQISQSRQHKKTLQEQSAMLDKRTEQLMQQLSELRVEEEALARAASSADAEVSRTTSMYQGFLDEAALATRKLASALSPASGRNAAGSLTKHFMFQCEDEVDEMCCAIKDYMTELGEFVETGMRKADVLPSPWKEFEPFATRSVADLLNVAKSEHGRIARDIVPMAQLKLKLDIERELLLASRSEADKALASGDLVQRCEQYMHDGEHASGWTSSVEAHAVNLSGAVLSHLEEPGQVRHFGDVMEQLRQQWAALAENRRDQQSQDLEIAAQSIGPQRQAADEAMHRLAEEQADSGRLECDVGGGSDQPGAGQQGAGEKTGR